MMENLTPRMRSVLRKWYRKWLKEGKLIEREPGSLHLSWWFRQDLAFYHSIDEVHPDLIQLLDELEPMTD